MKYTVNIDETQRLVDSMRLVEDGSQVEFIMGVRKMKENQVMCCFRVTGRTEQILTRFYPLVDEDVVEPESFVVDVKQFAGVLSAMASYNKDIVIDSSNVSSVGVSVSGEKDALASAFVDRISGGCETPEIPMNASEIIFQIMCNTSKFKTFAQSGCMFSDSARGNGCENVILQLNLSKKQLLGYSSDCYVIGKAKENIDAIDEQMKQYKNALDKYLLSKMGNESVEKIFLLVPEKSFAKILKVIDGCEQFGLMADAKHLFVGAGSNAFTLTFGAQKIELDRPIACFEAAESVATLKMASKELLKAVQTMKKIGTIKKGGDKVCLHVTVEDEKLCLTTESDSIQVPLSEVTVREEKVDFYCYSNLLEKSISSIMSDSMTMNVLVGSNPVKMTGANDDFNTIYMLKSQKQTSVEKPQGTSAEVSE